MDKNLEYKFWLANKNICRTLHEFSMRLPPDIRIEYLHMLDGIATQLKENISVVSEHEDMKFFSTIGFTENIEKLTDNKT